MNGGGGRLRVGTETGEALTACFNDAARADADKVRRHETACLLRGFCVKPLVFDLQNGLSCRSGMERLRRGAEQRQTGKKKRRDEAMRSQILMNIFLR